MGRDTPIAWCRSTANLAVGCTRVTTECDKCFLFTRILPRRRQDPSRIVIIGDTPEKVQAIVRKMRSPCFLNVTTDTFHRAFSDQLLDMWTETLALRFHQTIFQILTKRTPRMLTYFQSRWPAGVPSNFWLGTSVGIKSVVPRIEILRRIKRWSPHTITFVSFEPLLEDLGEVDLSGVDWILIGGESDRKDWRPMRPEWAENLVSQGRRHGCAVFFKQIGGKGGDGAGGDVLNGRQIKEFPTGFHWDQKGELRMTEKVVQSVS